MGWRALRAVAARPAPGCRAPCVRADLAWLRLRWDTAADQAEAEIAFGEAFEKGLGSAAHRRRKVGQPRRGDRASGAGAVRRRSCFAPDERLAAEVLAAR